MFVHIKWERLKKQRGKMATISNNPLEHKQRHEFLHKALDELVADMLTRTDRTLSTITVMQLMEWSHQQTLEPTENYYDK